MELSSRCRDWGHYQNWAECFPFLPVHVVIYCEFWKSLSCYQYICVMQTLQYWQQTTSRKCQWGATEIVQITVLSTMCTAHLTSPKHVFINKVVSTWNVSSVFVEWQMGHLVCVCALARVLQTTVNWQWLSTNEWQSYINNFLLWTQLISSVGSMWCSCTMCIHNSLNAGAIANSNMCELVFRVLKRHRYRWNISVHVHSSIVVTWLMQSTHLWLSVSVSYDKKIVKSVHSHIEWDKWP